MPPNDDPSLAQTVKIDTLLSAELRFLIMTVLGTREQVEFSTLRDELGATDGNLSANLSKLEEAGYLTAKKEFVGKKPKTTYRITALGLERFAAYLDTMDRVRQSLRKETL